MTKRNYYDVLGVPKDADQTQIKQGFRRWASQAHPDKGGDAELMAEINEAYACLSDPIKRAYYDEHGSLAPEQSPEEADAERLFFGLMKAVLDAPDFDSLHISFKMQEMVAKEIEERQEQVRALKKKQKFAEDLAKAYTSKPGIRNSYVEGFETRAAQCREEAENMEKMVRVLGLVKTMTESAQHKDAKYKDYKAWKNRETPQSRDDLESYLIQLMRNQGKYFNQGRF